jgi:DNA-nicking Smr family endonuclease
MVRRLAPEEKALWGRVMATVKPIAATKAPVQPMPTKSINRHPRAGGGPSPELQVSSNRPVKTQHSVMDSRLRGNDEKSGVSSNLDATWDRRIHKGGIIPDISVDLHETTLSGAYARLDRTLEQAIHQKLRVVLLVTGHARGHDRASGQGRGAIAAVVGDWLAASRHASAISAVRQAHPRHGGAGALYIVLKRNSLI